MVSGASGNQRSWFPLPHTSRQRVTQLRQPTPQAAAGRVAAPQVLDQRLGTDPEVNREGVITATHGESSTDPLFEQDAKRCVEKWTFVPDSRQRRLSVTFYFGFAWRTG